MSKIVWKPQLPLFRQYKQKVYQQIIKTGQFVYQVGELDKLRKKSKKVSVKSITSKEFRKKVKYVKKCLLKYRKLTGKGRGISAVQVGIPEAFSVIYFPEMLNQVQHDEKGEYKHQVDKNGLLTIINPKIIKSSSKLLKYPEMCMSVVPIISPNVRPSWIEFEYYDEFGNKRYWDTKDTDKKARMYNRVFQHEIDHINGIINIDLVKSKELILESDPHFYEKAEFEKV